MVTKNWISAGMGQQSCAMLRENLAPNYKIYVKNRLSLAINV
jgi:hypothetical protein